MIGRQRIREFIACKSPFAKSAFAGLQRFQRDIASFHPLFFTPARLRNSKISAAKAIRSLLISCKTSENSGSARSQKGHYGNPVHGLRCHRLNNPHSNNT
jgi:hypothetical protein